MGIARTAGLQNTPKKLAVRGTLEPGLGSVTALLHAHPPHLFSSCQLSISNSFSLSILFLAPEGMAPLCPLLSFFLSSKGKAIYPLVASPKRRGRESSTVHLVKALSELLYGPEMGCALYKVGDLVSAAANEAHTSELMSFFFSFSFLGLLLIALSVHSVRVLS